MTARDIVAALSRRHEGDIFIPECKMGATTTDVGSSRRLDAWAMRMTWSPVTICGYEVKVSRSDFMQDTKYTEYAPVCTELYVAIPYPYKRQPVATAAELPPSVGLIHVLGNGQARVVRKAVRREPEYRALAHLLMYVLMSRTHLAVPGHCANVLRMMQELDTWEAAQTDDARVAAMRTLLTGVKARQEGKATGARMAAALLAERKAIEDARADLKRRELGLADERRRVEEMRACAGVLASVCQKLGITSAYGAPILRAADVERMSADELLDHVAVRLTSDYRNAVSRMLNHVRSAHAVIDGAEKDLRDSVECVKTTLRLALQSAREVGPNAETEHE